ncbi:hypothetical protein CCYA_CCYA14G3715 [Cyanidiococcus yangmingshanensis]|nr:hypothetical protein CCYA_CCYA14G3715 [Cyanidiococcus yangmingshanensis]
MQPAPLVSRDLINALDIPWASVRTVMAVASALVAIQQVNWVPSFVNRVGFTKRQPAATAGTAPDKSPLAKFLNRLHHACQRILVEKWHWFRVWSQHEHPDRHVLWRRLVTSAWVLARGCFTILVLKYLEKRLDSSLRVFPGALTGLVLLVGALGALERLGCSRVRSRLERFCAPALTFLAEWMPLFFAPPLVALPARLFTGGISKRELGAIAGVLFSGFVTSLVASAWATRALLRWQAREHPSEEEDEASDAAKTSTSNATRVRSAAVQDAVIFGLSTVLAILCVLRAGARRDRLLLAVVTALSYRLGTRTVPQRWQRILHPVLTCAAMTAIVTSQVELSPHALGQDVASAAWYHRLERYPILAGNWFMQLLGPSLMALAFRLYRARALLGRHLLPLCGGSGFAAVFSLFWTTLASRVLGLKTPALRRALLPRSITMPLAIASANRLRADTGITVASVLISGILGASLGPTILSLGPGTPAVARGVALGGVSHGLGTAALAAAGDSTAASAAVIALGLVGTITTSLLSSPVARWIAS